MGYTALYRKFRPHDFNEVRGQEHIVTTLKNQVQSGRTAHAYLFCGTRGTGKTTIARILAKAVNCESPVNGSPCGKCEMCKKLDAGTSMNVIEIDAASNNGVDNIRQIVDEVQYSPTEGNYKVYIIDEVHMLSSGAFNALLKTLEEPPAYVMFILATTEAHKIPITILSRCQRYDFKRIGVDTIAETLSDLMKQEGIEAEERALKYVAKVGDGSMRDSLSLLDQCLAFSFGKKLTYDGVLETLGAVDVEVFGQLFEYIRSKNTAGCLDITEKLVGEGKDLTQFTSDFTWYFRNLLLLNASDEAADRIDVSSDRIPDMKNAAKSVSANDLMRYIRIFSELAAELKYSMQKRVAFEIALIKLCKPQAEENLDSLVARVEELEAAVKSGAGLRAATMERVKEQAAKEEKEETPQIDLEAYEKALPEDVKEAISHWPDILASLQTFMIKNVIDEAMLTNGNDGSLVLVFSDDEKKDFMTEQRITELKEAVAKVIGKNMEIRVTGRRDGNASLAGPVDLRKIIQSKIKLPIEDSE